MNLGSTPAENGRNGDLNFTRLNDTWRDEHHNDSRRIERMEWKRTDERTTTSTMNEFDSIFIGRIERSCWDIQQQKNKLVVDLWITSQDHKVITDHKWKWLDSWEERRNAKLHFKRIRRINCTLRSKKKILELLEQESWWTLEEWIKSWRATVVTPPVWPYTNHARKCVRSRSGTHGKISQHNSKT